MLRNNNISLYGGDIQGCMKWQFNRLCSTVAFRSVSGCAWFVSRRFTALCYCMGPYFQSMISATPPVRPSVHPSGHTGVTLIGCDHISWDTWIFITRLLA